MEPIWQKWHLTKMEIRKKVANVLEINNEISCSRVCLQHCGDIILTIVTLKLPGDHSVKKGWRIINRSHLSWFFHGYVCFIKFFLKDCDYMIVWILCVLLKLITKEFLLDNPIEFLEYEGYVRMRFKRDEPSYNINVAVKRNV